MVVAAETVDQVDRLPRGACPACGRDVALRKGGSIVREHRVYLPQLEQDPSTLLGRTRVCEGSGLAPETVRGHVATPTETPDDVATETDTPASSFQSGHCAEHPELELVTHHRAGLRWWGEDPETVCPSSDHTQADQDRCRWCGGPVTDPGIPGWQRSRRKAYCKPHHRLLAFRARQAAAR